MRLPSEVLRLVVENLKLPSLAEVAAASREANAWCQKGLHRRWCCRTCGLPVLHPRDVYLNLGPRAGTHTGGLLAACCDAGSLRRGPALTDEELWDVLQHGAALGQAGQPRFVTLLCVGCDKHLGDEFELEPGRTLTYFRGGCLALHDSEGRIRRRAGHDRSLMPAPSPLRCSGSRGRPGKNGCQVLISYMDEVMSTQHCWRPIGGSVEQAWFVNAIDAAVQVGPTQPAQLAQGPMSVADVFCPGCGANVGWKFVADEEGINRSQVGRFGLVLSSLRSTPTTREWQQDPLVAALERCTSWAALEMQEEPREGGLATLGTHSTSTCSSDLSSEPSSDVTMDGVAEPARPVPVEGTEHLSTPAALRRRLAFLRFGLSAWRLQAARLLRSVLARAGGLLMPWSRRRPGAADAWTPPGPQARGPAG